VLAALMSRDPLTIGNIFISVHAKCKNASRKAQKCSTPWLWAVALPLHTQKLSLLRQSSQHTLRQQARKLAQLCARAKDFIARS